jgi:hypothetical protein
VQKHDKAQWQYSGSMTKHKNTEAQKHGCTVTEALKHRNMEEEGNGGMEAQ